MACLFQRRLGLHPKKKLVNRAPQNCSHTVFWFAQISDQYRSYLQNCSDSFMIKTELTNRRYASEYPEPLQAVRVGSIVLSLIFVNFWRKKISKSCVIHFAMRTRSIYSPLTLLGLDVPLVASSYCAPKQENRRGVKKDWSCTSFA